LHARERFAYSRAAPLLLCADEIARKNQFAAPIEAEPKRGTT